MNKFKAVSCASARWTLFEDGKNNKRLYRRKSRHTLNGKDFRKILLEEIAKKA